MSKFLAGRVSRPDYKLASRGIGERLANADARCSTSRGGALLGSVAETPGQRGSTLSDQVSHPSKPGSELEGSDADAGLGLVGWRRCDREPDTEVAEREVGRVGLLDTGFVGGGEYRGLG
jgi:hypothetical protein